MDMMGTHALEPVLRHFRTGGTFLRAESHGSGHIHSSFRATFREGAGTRRFLLQRINTGIFKQPGSLMRNVQRVTSHLAAKLAGEADAERRVLRLVLTQDGHTWYQDPEAGAWRMYEFLENTRTYDAVRTAGQAFHAAQAFGSFQQRLCDLPAPRLLETIPDFHNTPKRFRNCEDAIAADAVQRAASAGAEIRFVLARRSVASILLDAGLPERVTHNDTKLNNVLFDAASDEALCVVDLDTVMPGLALYDFGDMVRTATSSSAEDEQDLSRVTMQFPLFEALLRGYLSTAGNFLTEAEKDHLAVCGKVIALEQAVRFLEDYLRGDVYYKVQHPDRNLHRCRTQLKLIASIEAQQSAMERLVKTV